MWDLEKKQSFEEELKKQLEERLEQVSKKLDETYLFKTFMASWPKDAKDREKQEFLSIARAQIQQEQEGGPLQPGQMVLFNENQPIWKSSCTHAAIRIGEHIQACFFPEFGLSPADLNAVHAAVLIDRNIPAVREDESARKNALRVATTGNYHKIAEAVASGLTTNNLDGSRSFDVFAPRDFMFRLFTNYASRLPLSQLACNGLETSYSALNCLRAGLSSGDTELWKNKELIERLLERLGNNIKESTDEAYKYEQLDQKDSVMCAQLVALFIIMAKVLYKGPEDMSPGFPSADLVTPAYLQSLFEHHPDVWEKVMEHRPGVLPEVPALEEHSQGPQLVMGKA